MMAFFPKTQPPLFHRSSRPEVSSKPVSKQRSMSLTNKGLLNPSGHNNCFLNSCVQMFHMVVSEAAGTEYVLSGMVAYYGHHYCTFCYHTVLRQWIFFDDANFRTIGSSWSEVVELCRKAHYQPLLLVYTNPFAEKLTMTTAPTKVTKFVVTETKTNTLTAVTEAEETAVTDSKKMSVKQSEKPLTGSGLVIQPASEGSSSRVSPTPGAGSTVPQSNGEPGSGAVGSHSGTKPGHDAEYKIDPNTLSLRRNTPGPSLYPQLSRLESEGGGGGDVQRFPVPSAPPQQMTTTQPSSTFPVIFQSSPANTRASTQPGANNNSFPFFFQPSPAAPSYPGRPQQFAPFTSSPPTHQTTLPNSSGLYHQQRPTSYATNAPYFTGGVYSQPTYPHHSTQPQANSQYGSHHASSPWRGTGGGGLGSALGGLLQPTQQSHGFNTPSSPISSHSLIERSRQPQSATHTTPGVAVSSAKPVRNSHGHTASSTQPLTATKMNSAPSPSSAGIARPRPPPPRSILSPNQVDQTKPTQKSSLVTDRASHDLIEFSLSPALLVPTAVTNQPSLTQGPTPHPPSTNTTKLSSTRESEVISSANSSGSSSSTGPEQGRGGLSSLEEDLIQWSLSPDLIQRVQRYRGRQGVRHGSSDSLVGSLLTSSTGAESGSGVREHSANTAGVSGRELQPKQSQFNGHSTDIAGSRVATAVPNSTGEGVLIELAGVGREGEDPQREREETMRGRESAASDTVLKRETERVLDPLYEDPDIIQATLDQRVQERAHTTETAPPDTGPSQSRVAAIVEPESLREGVQQGSSGVGGKSEEPERERLGLGEDPLYAVPEQVAAKLKAKRTAAITAHHQTSPHSTEIPDSVQPLLQEALEMWQKAESKRESDVVVAKMNYSRAATLLTKVLLEPVDQGLKESVSQKRQQALVKCSEMDTLISHKQPAVYGRDGRCGQCGQLRQLNSDQICGPCHLKNKVRQT